MSVVLYHARVDERTLERLRENPDLLWEAPQDAAPTDAQLLYTDKDWAALSWLLSAKAREEQKHDLVIHALGPGRKDLADHDAWRAAMAEEASKRGFQLADTQSMPDDPALTAIEGRGPRDGRLEIGYRARTFNPNEVAVLSAALEQITEANLRERFDPNVMESMDVAGICWTKEDSDVVEAILIPVFERLKRFFALAARARQHVVVVVT